MTAALALVVGSLGLAAPAHALGNGEGKNATVLYVLGGIVVAGLLVVLASGDDDDSPTPVSP